MVAHLAFGQQQDDRLAGAIADGMELGVQAAFRAPDTTGNIPWDYQEFRVGPLR